MKEPNVTIVSSMYGASDEFLKKQQKLIDKQKYTGKIYHILINDNVKNPRKIKGLNIVNNKKNLGVCASLNKGFRMSKTDIIVALADDCLPSSDTWLRKVVSPFSDPSVAGVTTKVELPKSFWDKFDFYAKALTEKEQKIISPGLDAKGCGYRKRALEEFGYLDEKEFRQGGEDTDLTIKIEKSNKWKRFDSDAKVYHYHHFTSKGRLAKEIQYARLTGLVSRKHFFNLNCTVRGHIALKLIIMLFLIYSAFDISMLKFSIPLVLLISNLRYPFQWKRLKHDKRIYLVPFLNLYLYFLYVINYSYALIFKPVV